MRRKLTTLTKAITLTAIAAMAMSIPAFAGSWRADGERWWYDNGDGTWAKNGWQWIDGNGDGIGESYYFDTSGYLLVSTTTPDGYTVNESGAWTANGQVQQMALTAPSAQNNAVNSEWIDAYAAFLSSRTQKPKYGKNCFSLIYIDGDAIPELFIHNTAANHHQGAELYTYYNGQVVELGEFGNCGGFNYLEKQNRLYWFDSGMGLSLWAFYQIADGKAVKLNYYESTERYENGYVASTTYSQNEAALSEAEYNSRLDADIGDASAYKTATAKDALEITAGNIQKMQEDAGSVIR